MALSHTTRFPNRLALSLVFVLMAASLATVPFQVSTASATTCPDRGIVWTSRTSTADNNWRSVAYGGGLFVAVSVTGSGNRVMTSPDGITWTGRTSAVDNNWYSVAYGGGLFVAVADTDVAGPQVMTSPDGITWTSRSTSPIPPLAWQSVAYGGGQFVAVAASGALARVMTSPDGISWTSRTAADTKEWRSVAYGGPAGSEVFVAVANSGAGNRVMTSPDGITWTTQASAADNGWVSVTYGGGLFVAVSNSGTGNRVMTSPDGITWTSRTSAANNDWYSVAYGGGQFVAVGASGTGNRVMTSPDGITWTSRTSAANNSWVSVAYGDGQFVAVSLSGTGNRVMTSGCATSTPPGDSSSVAAVTHTVSYASSGGSGSGPVSPLSVLSGATFTTPANTFTREGFVFAGWSDGVATYSAGASYPASGGVSADVVLSAVWKRLPTFNVLSRDPLVNTSFGLVASSGDVTVTLSSSTPSVCRVVGLSVVFMTPGTCQVRANVEETEVHTFSAQVKASTANGRRNQNARGSTRRLDSQIVYFAPDSAVLTPTTQRELRALLARTRRSGAVTVTGHAADAGNPKNAVALELSKRRAQAVADFLAAGGVSVTIESAQGKKLPASSDRRKNRRVEIAWYSSGT